MDKDGWRPIETAPKRYGEWIIACRAGQEDSSGPVTWAANSWRLPDGERWKQGHLTHWQPLPSPPSENKDSEDGR